MDRGVKVPRSPFKATQLWNEAINILQNGMPTHRHYKNLRFYNRCFSGKEAISWFSKALLNNPKFGQNVTIEGTTKLLQHFLTAGVFQCLKGTMIFKRYGLYEFSNNLIQSPFEQDVNHQFSQMGLNEVNPKIMYEITNLPNGDERLKSYSQYPTTASSETTYSGFLHWTEQPPKKDMVWKDFIFKRIASMVPSIKVELLVDQATIESNWIMCNVCPQFDSMRKKTELPIWVFTGISSIIYDQENEPEYTTYDGFEKDVYSIVRNYLRGRSSPLIPYGLYELVMFTFNHLHYLDLEKKNRPPAYNSVENLVLSMSCDWNDHLSGTDNITRTVLPPNSCFETAFTSDDPVTRIVPQSCIDSICLGSHKTAKASTGVNFSRNSYANVVRNCEDSFDLNASSEELCVPVVKRTVCKKQNKKISCLRRTQSVAHIDSNAMWQTVTETKPSWGPPHQSCDKYGQSQSTNNLSAMGNNVTLNFEEALESVNCLLRASSEPQPRGAASSCASVSSCHIDKASLVGFDWCRETQKTAGQVLHAVFILMPPAARTSLRMLLQFIGQLPVIPHASLNQLQVVYDLSAHILAPGPQSKDVYYSDHLITSVVYFLIDHCKNIFEEFPPEDLMETEEVRLLENKPVEENKVFCEQLTPRQYEAQRVNSSRVALGELLEQIINDTKMKSSEKKRKLKMFKGAYPHIYKERFGQPSTAPTSMVHFR